jgi:hypothetical protein
VLRQFSETKNFALAASDGEIGKVKELYFDDQSWTARYLVVDTGGWLSDRKVLIPPHSLGVIDNEHQLIAVHLTREQVEKSPPIETAKPVSRQYEEEWHAYYGYPGYWLAPDTWAVGAIPPSIVAPPVPPGESEKEFGDPHLRSTGEVIGYSIRAHDGDIGHVDDFVVDDAGWIVRYVVITRSWWPGKKVLLAPEWIERISWDEMKAFVPISRDTIKDAPDWDDSQPITRAFEERLYDYYGHKRYWPIET